jgi:hypothetical protein
LMADSSRSVLVGVSCARSPTKPLVLTAHVLTHVLLFLIARYGLHPCIHCDV